MFEFEMIVAFGAGAALMAMAPVVRKMGNHELGDSMGQTGRSMAKSGVKVEFSCTPGGHLSNSRCGVTKVLVKTQDLQKPFPKY